MCPGPFGCKSLTGACLALLFKVGLTQNVVRAIKVMGMEGGTRDSRTGLGKSRVSGARPSGHRILVA